MSFAALFADCSAALANVAPSELLPRASSQNDVPPRYVWIPNDHSFAAPMHKGPFGRDGPRALQTKLISAQVECWGDTIEDAERLEQALVTALHNSLQRNYIPRSSRWMTPQHRQCGFVLLHSFEAQMTLLEANLTWPVTDAVTETVTITAVELDQTGATSTDGELRAGE